MTEPLLLSLATAVPPYVIDQDEAAARAAALFAGRVFRTPDLMSLFANTGIRTRRSVRPMDWYAEPRSWPERNAVYLEAAEALYIEATEKALAAAGLRADQIGTVVTVSSTGIATPSLEARLAGRLGFRPGVRRVPVFGLGCAGGVSGLAIAARLAQSIPGEPVLLVVVELCTLSCRPDEFTKANVVATALFGDGAAALMLRAGDGGTGRRIEGSGEHIWPDTLDIMGWRIDPVGFGVILSSDLPAFVTREFRIAGAQVLSDLNVSRDKVGRFVFHPGGARVLPALEASLDLPEGSLDLERQVLADYGNMSAPTVLFVLERALAAGVEGRLMLGALGPGFTATFVSLGPA